MTASRRQSRGFTLTEMLIVLILMGFFALAASRLFYATVTLSRTAAQSENNSASFESALSALRSDVWRATKIDEDDGKGLVHLTIGDQVIMWTIGKVWRDGPNGTPIQSPFPEISRVEDTGDHRSWPSPPGATLASEKSRVVLRVPAAQGTRAAEFWLSSQPLLALEMTR